MCAMPGGWDMNVEVYVSQIDKNNPNTAETVSLTL